MLHRMRVSRLVSSVWDYSNKKGGLRNRSFSKRNVYTNISPISSVSLARLWLWSVLDDAISASIFLCSGARGFGVRVFNWCSKPEIIKIELSPKIWAIYHAGNTERHHYIDKFWKHGQLASWGTKLIHVSNFEVTWISSNSSKNAYNNIW